MSLAQNTSNLGKERSISGIIIFREFIIDFVAAFVPGITFLTFIVPSFFYPLIVSFYDIVSSPEHKKEWIDLSTAILNNVSPFFIVIIFFVLSYVTGNVLHKQDPKKPDRNSFNRLNENSASEGPHKLVEDIKKGGLRYWLCRFINLFSFIFTFIPCKNISKFPPEFPYNNLKGYFNQRNLNHLKELIPWEAEDETRAKRTKHFINILKARIEYEVPEKYINIVRNEAHVRLNSSTWYGASALSMLSFIGIIFGIIDNIYYYRDMELLSIFKLNNPSVIFFPLIIFIIALFVKISIEKVLHYQRIREIVNVMETAYWISKREGIDLFIGLVDGHDELYTKQLTQTSSESEKPCVSIYCNHQQHQKQEGNDSVESSQETTVDLNIESSGSD